MPPTPLRAGLRRFPHAVAAVLLAALALLVPALPAGAVDSAGTSSVEADAVYALLNDARTANGQNLLVRNPSLDQVAAAWAAQLSAVDVLSHNPDYPTQIPAGWSEAGENVARGQWTASEMHTDWMNSPGHRANILGTYTDVGVAWLTDAVGMTWGVQVFANYPAPVVAVAPTEITAELDTLALPNAPAVEAADASADVIAASPEGPIVGAGVEWLLVGLAAVVLLLATAAALVILRRSNQAARP